jgi:hypothetical protein
MKMMLFMSTAAELRPAVRLLRCDVAASDASEREVMAPLA